MQVTVRIPSKKVPYGFLEFQQEVPSLDPLGLAEMYAQLIKDYQMAEVAAFEAAPTKPKVKVEDTSVEEAAKMLSDGLGGAEEIEENAPAKPWDKSADESTTESKPWEADEADWDFS